MTTTSDALDPHRLTALAERIDAPEVVIACSCRGRRALVTGGTARRPAPVLTDLRYEIGSVTKTFTGLLLTHLTHRGVLALTDPVARHLPGQRQSRGECVTLGQLITHTSGLPRLPRNFYRHALPRWRTNPYAHYTTRHLIEAFDRAQPRVRPGPRWRYSNFGVALLGPALATPTISFEQLMTDQILTPLGLTSTAMAPTGPAHDAVGHRVRSDREVPPFDAGAFTAAGALRATPHDLLTYLEAHLQPERHPALQDALCAVQQPEPPLRGGHRWPRTLTWFRYHDDDPILFHGGATPGQQAFLGYRPATRTAVVALATRRNHLGNRLQQQAYELLT